MELEAALVQLESKPLPRIHYHPSPGNLISGHPQGLPLEGVGYDFCCGEAGTGGTCSLVGAGWEVVSRAESLDLEAQGLLKPPNGHCDAGPGLKAMRGLLKQLPVWGTGHCMWPRQRRAMCCREERTKCVPGRTLTGETLVRPQATGQADPRSRLFKDLTELYSYGSATVPQVVSEGSRHLQLPMAFDDVT